MSTWNTPNQRMPAIGDAVQFIVKSHRTWRSGTYEGCCFRSRWAAYACGDVVFWRPLDGTPQLAAPTLVAEGHGYAEQPRRCA